jgi:hydrogenase nickel incorporation protein HypA/HybF
MHELAIAESIVEIAARHSEGRKVTRVELRVGHLRQVVPSALEFAFELLAEGTALEGSELVIEEVPADVRCRVCATESTLRSFPACCPACGTFDVEVQGGDELLVDSLEIEEPEEALTRMGG